MNSSFIRRFVIFVALAMLVFPACDSAEEDGATEDEEAEEIVAEEDEGTAAAGQESEPDELVVRARELGALANDFREDPPQLQAWLDDEEMTEEQFEDLLFDISQHPAASQAYSEAR